jgi:tetratricopeptide (TPR) repeat protein
VPTPTSAATPPTTADGPSGSVSEALAHATRLLERNPALARRQAQEILGAVPNHPEALLILAIAYRRNGDPQAAAPILNSLAASQPKSARTHYELGLAHAALGEDAAAIAALRRAVAINPATSAAWRTLGDMLTLAGDTEAADAAYASHIRSAVNDAALMRAADALCTGNLPTAERLLRDRLKIAPTDVAALRMLAETGTRLGRYADAEKLLARTLELAPSFTAARHNYAIVLFRQRKAAEAIPHIERLLAQDPRDIGYRNLLAACLATIGEYNRSIVLYEGILKEQPKQPKIWLSYGHALKTAGRRQDSVRAYRHSIDLAPTMGEAWWSLANLKNEAFSVRDIEMMQAQLQDTRLTVEDRFHLHYALGRALEETSNYQESFTHYAEGAKLRRGEIAYSANETSAQVRRATNFFTPQFFAAHATHGCPDPAPIFIIGLPRAGSTLIEQILASHSAIEGTMELPEIANIARDLGSRHTSETAQNYPESLANISPEEIAALGARFIDRTRIYRKTNKPFFIDKMPNNWAHIGLIHLILPHAKIIDARRHPIATCFSAFKQHFARGQNFSYDLIELGRYYNDYVALMEHFDSILPGRIHRVQYETMVENTEAETRRLLTYCNLPFEPACLRFWETDRPVRTASSEQVRQPIFREGLDHWKNYKPWLAPLEKALKEGQGSALDPLGP